MDAITYWNDVALECDRRAHTDVHASEAGSRGPIGASRALAIVHLAMHDAYFTTVAAPAFAPWLGVTAPVPDAVADPDAAVGAAAHAALSALYPNQKSALQAAHVGAGLSGKGVAEGHTHGLAVAQAVLAARAGDPGTGDAGHVASPAYGRHRPDPTDPGQGFHAPHYGARARCFAATTRHRLDAPPQPGSVAYEEALDEVRGKGIDPAQMGGLPGGSPRRTPEETLVGLFWAYDGVKGLGPHPRFYNRIIRAVADRQNNDAAMNARLFALVNVAMADAGTMAWDDKFEHDLWRPVIGIREHDTSMGPAGEPGHHLDTDADPFWLPLGAPRTNTGRPGFSPPFPAYPSGHASFGAAAFQTTRLFYGATTDGPDTLADGLEFVSEELDGISTGNGVVRPRHTRRFPGGLWQMIEENGRSRVYLGVHWVFDAFAVSPTGQPDLTQNVGGVRLGLEVAKNIATHGLDVDAAAGPRLP